MRYQNISTVTTSIRQKSPLGDYRTMTVRPGQIVHVEESDIIMTRDSYNPQENNPFDSGMIAEIPEGESRHPDAPVLHRNPTLKQIQDVVKMGDLDKFSSLAAKVQDARGIALMHRALDLERQAITDSQFSQMDRTIDKQSQIVQTIQEENEEKYGAKA